MKWGMSLSLWMVILVVFTPAMYSFLHLEEDGGTEEDNYLGFVYPEENFGYLEIDSDDLDVDMDEDGDGDGGNNDYEWVDLEELETSDRNNNKRAYSQENLFRVHTATSTRRLPASVYAVVIKAFEILSAEPLLQSFGTVPIRVSVIWKALPSTVLGSAGPSFVHYSAQRNVIYVDAVYNQLVRKDVNVNVPEITMNLNSAFTKWWLNVDLNTPVTRGRYDMLTVVLHELMHGLGVIGYVQSGGKYNSPLSGAYMIYDANLQSETNQRVYSQLTSDLHRLYFTQQRFGRVLSRNIQYERNKNIGLEDLGIYLYTPSTFQQGSSIYHSELVNSDPVNINPSNDSIMKPSLRSSLRKLPLGDRIASGLLYMGGWNETASGICSTSIGYAPFLPPDLIQYHTNGLECRWNDKTERYHSIYDTTLEDTFSRELKPHFCFWNISESGSGSSTNAIPIHSISSSFHGNTQTVEWIPQVFSRPVIISSDKDVVCIHDRETTANVNIPGIANPAIHHIKSPSSILEWNKELQWETSIPNPMSRVFLINHNQAISFQSAVILPRNPLPYESDSDKEIWIVNTDFQQAVHLRYRNSNNAWKFCPRTIISYSTTDQMILRAFVCPADLNNETMDASDYTYIENVFLLDLAPQFILETNLMLVKKCSKGNPLPFGESVCLFRNKQLEIYS